VACYDSLRVLLSLAASRDLEISQFDVKTAFLYGELKENIYMEIPEGLVDPQINETTVCKLNKSMYGLKQAPRSWNQKFHSFLKSFKFKKSSADNCIQGVTKQTFVCKMSYF